MQDNIALAVLQDVDCLLVGQALEADVVHREDLIPALEPALFHGGALVEHRLDEDGHVAVRGAEPAHNAEAEAVLAPGQGDGGGRAAGHHVGGEALVPAPPAPVTNLQQSPL